MGRKGSPSIAWPTRTATGRSNRSGHSSSSNARASNTVRTVVPRLERGGTISRPYLGVSTLASTNGSGALVADAVGGGPADQGGVEIGDVPVEVQRGGSTQTLHVKLGTRPENVSTP